ncbi:MAG: putative O-glycosylation ligase, exosortase A system-associated [Rhodospirillales bacterium]|nr:MAG: putative O-glycosylation ligase, exosortase A system-associated [Rhodospirillales bacterium]
MRMILIFGIVAVIILLALSYPIAGLFGWAWFTMMQPHRETWGMEGFRLNLIIAVFSIGAWLISREPKAFPPTAPHIFILIFTLWVIASQIFSLKPNVSYEYTDRYIRVLAMIFLCAAMLHNKVRVHALVWVICIAIGYFGIKGGVFTIITGGNYRVWGPTDSVIGDNNHIGAALAFIIPLLNYLRLQSQNRWLRAGLVGAIVLTFFGVLGSHSRTAFLALFAGLALMWWRSRHRLVLVAALAPIAVIGLTFMPEHWHERMETIRAPDQDASFMARVGMWKLAIEAGTANPVTGIGLRVIYVQEIADRYSAEPLVSRAIHSSYLEILAGMGYPGLILFMGLIMLAVRDSFWIRRHSKNKPDQEWAFDLASMAQVCLIVYGVASLALSMEFWQGPWMLFVVLSQVRWQLAKQGAATRPAGSRFRKRPAGSAAPASNTVPRSSQRTAEGGPP